MKKNHLHNIEAEPEAKIEAQKNKVKSAKKREPDFVKLYVMDICRLYELKKNAYQVLMHALYFLDYQGNITLTALHRKQIAKQIDKTDRTVKNQLALLTQKKIFKRVSNMVYAVNPELFARGEWTNIKQMRDEFKLIVEYKSSKRVIKGRSLKSEYPALREAT